MSDDLAIITRLIDEHQILKRHVKLVGDSITDEEALRSLERARADWIPGRTEILAEKHNKLQQTMSFLDEGLNNHFAFEEKVLPPFLGELLMHALVLEHREIKNQVDEAKSMIANARLDGLSREELLAKESQLQQRINGICSLVNEHRTREEAVLEMLQRALGAKEQDKG